MRTFAGWCPVKLGDGGTAFYHVNVPDWKCGVCGWTPQKVKTKKVKK